MTGHGERTVVVGGGVMGLTTAVVLAEAGRQVTVWSRDAAADTASAVSGGFVWPYRIEPAADALAWAVESFHEFAALAADPERTGVRLRTGRVDGSGGVPAAWRELVGSPARTPLLETGAYLAYLRGRLEAAGGRCERRTLTSLAEAAERAGTVVNCAGLGARELVPDPSVRPVRGQIVVVENPGLDEWYLAADEPAGGAGGALTYVLPQPYGVLLGGTADEDAEDLTPDPGTAREIVARCARAVPALAGARVLGHRVGLRPYRPRVRLEAEPGPAGTRVVHNYGHGGAGVTVSWGCAREAARLAVAHGTSH